MAEAAICRQLQKVFKTVAQILEKFQIIVKQNESDLASFKNLCEQYSISNKVDVDETVFKDTPDIKQQLLFKIQLDLEKHVKTFQSDLSELQLLAERISKLRESTFDLYERYDDQLPIALMTSTSVLWPSYASQLDLIVNLDREFQLQYLKRWKCMKAVNFPEADTLKNLSTVWIDTKDLERQVNVALSNVKHFMEEKF